MGKAFFFGLHLYLAGRCCENHQSARGPAQRKSLPGNNMVVDVTSYCTFFNNNSPLPRQFLRDKILLKQKISLGEMLTEQIIEFEFREHGSPGRKYTLIICYFHDKAKISKENLRVDYYLQLK